MILQRIAERTGLPKVHPYRFRHTFATWAIRASAREIDVQSLLGHSSLAMVQRYARPLLLRAGGRDTRLVQPRRRKRTSSNGTSGAPQAFVHHLRLGTLSSTFLARSTSEPPRTNRSAR